MRAGHRRDVAERGDAREDVAAVRRMAPDRGPFVGVGLSGLVEDLVRHRELADVVQQRRPAQPAAVILGQTHFLGDHVRIERHAARMVGGERTFRVHHVGEGRRDVVEILLVHPRRAQRRIHHQHAILDVRALEFQPEIQRVLRLEKRRDQRRIEPCPGPRADLRQRGRTPALGVEDVHDLREQRDVCVARNGVAGQAQGLAASVPVLVERADAVLDRVGKPHAARDVGAAMTAGLDQLAADLATVAQDADDGPDAFAQPRFEPGTGEHEPERGRQAVIDGLEVAFEGDVVREIELADPRRVAGAAEILQEQRVVEVRERLTLHPQLRPDPHADPAAAHAMPLRLALGHVERVAERAQKLRETDVPRPGTARVERDVAMMVHADSPRSA